MGENNWKEDKRRRGGEGGERVNMPVIRRSSKEKKKEKVAETLHNTPTGVYGFPGRKHQARFDGNNEDIGSHREKEQGTSGLLFISQLQSISERI